MLQSRIALISGGGSGLGRAAATRLLQLGARVLIADLPSSEGASVAAELGANAAFAAADCTDTAQVSQALDECERVFGKPVNVAVNCAGVLCASKTLNRKGAAHALELFEQTLRVNVVGTFNVTRLATQRMLSLPADGDGQRGVVVNTASIAAFDGQAGQVAYAASKGAIVSMTLPLARDLAPHGIRVCTVAPGVFTTPMMDGAPLAVREALEAQALFPKRLGRPEEYARMVEAILTNPFLNGEVIRLDGGVRMQP